MPKIERPTVEMKQPFVPETSIYSVSKRRATTEDERAALIERPGIPDDLYRRTARAGSVADACQVERVENHVVIRYQNQELALELEEARDLARLIAQVTHLQL